MKLGLFEANVLMDGANLPEHGPEMKFSDQLLPKMSCWIPWEEEQVGSS
jgi:hypothetical protein